MKVVRAAIAECQCELDGGMCWRDAAVRDWLCEGDDFVGTEPRGCDARVVEVCYGCGEGLEGWREGGGGVGRWDGGWLRWDIDDLGV